MCESNNRNSSFIVNNKQGQINVTPIQNIFWMPNSEHLFIAAHMDGSLVFYDKEKEDAPFIPEEPAPTTSTNGNVNGHCGPMKMDIKKSVQSRNQKTNPVAYWKLSNQKINQIAFSPDGTHLAVVSEDGLLKIIDYLKEQVIDVHRSYYGALLCVTWSPDSRYIVTGGQDDLVSIWSLSDRSLVARCQGHHSWVSDVKFDPWRCDERNYRIGSIGEDCRLLLWDFSVGMLGRPKVAGRARGNSNSNPLARRESYSASVTGRMRSNSNLAETDGTDGAEADGLYTVKSRASTATLPPVMVSYLL